MGKDKHGKEKVDGIKSVPLFVVSSQESLDSPIDRRSYYYRQKAREVRGAAPTHVEPQRLLNIPNLLTFARLILVPVFIFLWFNNHRFAPLTAASVFILASVTDWLDGYVARRMKIATEFGAFLDPVADKIMVSTALVLLAANPPAPLSQVDLSLPVLVIICREITMSSLREWAAASGGGAHKAVKVNSLGKWKTACQMVALSSMLLFRKGEAVLGTAPPVIDMLHVATRLALVILWIGGFLAVWSLGYYMMNVWHYFVYPGGIPADLRGKEQHDILARPPRPLLETDKSS